MRFRHSALLEFSKNNPHRGSSGPNYRPGGIKCQSVPGGKGKVSPGESDLKYE
jgi:hypothetical protein